MRKLGWIAVALLAACRKAPPEAEADGDAGARLAGIADRSLLAYDRITAAVEAAPDCGAAAAAIQGLLAAERPAIEQGVAMSGAAETDPVARRVLEARQERTAVLTRRMEQAFGRCSGVPAFEEALAALP